MVNWSNDAIGSLDGVKATLVNDGSDHDNEDDDSSGESAKDTEEGDFTHGLCQDDGDNHNGGGDHNPLLHSDVTSNRVGEVADVGSSQDQVENRPSQGDRVVKEGDNNTTGQSKGGVSHIGVLSKTVATSG